MNIRVELRERVLSVSTGVPACSSTEDYVREGRGTWRRIIVTNITTEVVNLKLLNKFQSVESKPIQTDQVI